MAFPVPLDEARRLEALRNLNILDTPAEERFDRITRLAQHLFHVPIALVSLIDKDRQWFKSRQGLEAHETPRDLAFCAHAILGPETMVVPDARLDPRFQANPLVTSDPNIRFYAGRPLATLDGSRVGTLCLIDNQPRQLNDDEKQVLSDLGALVENELNVVTLEAMNRELRLARAALEAGKVELEKRVRERTNDLAQAVHVLKQQIDEREAAERQVLANQERFEVAARAARDVIWEWDIATNLIWWNDNMQAFFLYTKEQVRPDLEFWMENAHPQDRDRVVAGLDEVIKSDELFWSDEYRFRRADGNYADVLDRAYVMRDHEGKPIRVIGAMTDITERRKMDARLRQSEKMIGMGQLAAGIAHELNNPLTGILGFAQAELETPGLSDSLRHSLEIIFRQGQRCTRLVKNLLNFAREQKESVKTPEDLARVAEDTLALVDVLAKGRRVKVIPKIQQGLPPASVHRDQIQQILVNLCVNAMDAMPDGGELTLILERNGEEAVLSVRDTGSGIPPEIQPRIFEAFFTTKEPGKGTGLGLSLVAEIVKTHQGKINFESEAGRGTMFTVALPFVAPATPQTQPLAA
jgi:PAS domain S-box-containing protein